MHNLKPFKKKSAQKQRSAKGRSNANKHWIRRLISASLVGMLLILGCVGCRPGNMMCRSRARSDDWFDDDDDDYFTEWEETTERLVPRGVGDKTLPTERSSRSSRSSNPGLRGAVRTTTTPAQPATVTIPEEPEYEEPEYEEPIYEDPVYDDTDYGDPGYDSPGQGSLYAAFLGSWDMYYSVQYSGDGFYDNYTLNEYRINCEISTDGDGVYVSLTPYFYAMDGMDFSELMYQGTKTYNAEIYDQYLTFAVESEVFPLQASGDGSALIIPLYMTITFWVDDNGSLYGTGSNEGSYELYGNPVDVYVYYSIER